MENHNDIKAFIYGGRAVFTLRSRKTSTRYTYRVKRKSDECFFVSYLVGPDHYEYIGTIIGRKGQRHFRTTKASKVTMDSVPVKAFKWSLDQFECGHLPVDLEFFHEGRCAKCARPLTVPESIKTGFGPECAKSRFACN